jgi:hypothetical protein
MPYGADIFSLVEDALSESFQYHNALDVFLRRASIPEDCLNAARARAEERAKESARFSRAPKRFVVQEILADLGKGGEQKDRLVAGLVTALCKGKFPDATPKAKTAIDDLKNRQVVEREEAEGRRNKQRAEELEEGRQRDKARAEKLAAREQFKDSFLQLSQQGDPRARGYMLEKFLNDFLTFEGLSPRGSFKLVGEQIDGSFAWTGRTYLVEAKWVAAPVGGAEFSSLMYKIEGKTADTRGLFISINGYSPEAIQGLKRKGELRFVCIDGAHLMRAFAHDSSFPKILEIIWRHANETGEAYLPVSASQFLGRSS